MRSCAAILVLGSLGFASARASATFDSATYFPLGLGDSWTYERCEGGGSGCSQPTYVTEIATCAPGAFDVVGVDTECLTNDDQGIRYWGGSFVSQGMVIDFGMLPPIQIVPALAEAGVKTNTSGTLYVQVRGGVGFAIPYSATGEVLPPETIEVPAGRFSTVPVVLTMDASGYVAGQYFSLSQEDTNWLARCDRSRRLKASPAARRRPPRSSRIP